MMASAGRSHEEPTVTRESILEPTVTRDSILQLMKRRDALERQIQSLGDILKSNNVGMTESLVDAEGFPRNDIDVYQVRNARHGIICFQNDFKAITKEIEGQLEIYHRNRQAVGNGIDVVQMETEENESQSQTRSIVKVNLVSEGSPAFHAGLKVDDEILSFGSINADNFTNVQDIGNVVQRSQGQPLTVIVRRNGVVRQLALIPGPWNGRGLLGCNILPIQTESVDR